MNIQEYTQWMKSMIRAYPEVSRRFGDSDDIDGRYEAWARALDRVPIDDCLDAIDAMVTGDLDKPQFGWSDLPKVVIGYCKAQANNRLARSRESYEDGRRISCLRCIDNSAGVVMVWNPWFVRDCGSALLMCENRGEVREQYAAWRRDGRSHGMGGISGSVICDCSGSVPSAKRKAVEAWRLGGRNKSPACVNVFDPAKFTLFVIGDPSELRERHLASE